MYVRTLIDLPGSITVLTVLAVVASEAVGAGALVGTVVDVLAALAAVLARARRARLDYTGKKYTIAADLFLYYYEHIVRVHVRS